MFIVGIKRGNFIVEFGEWLKQKLKEQGWTQGELSRRASVSRGAISNIISKRRLPSPESCVNIAKAFNMPPETVLRMAGYLPEIEADSATTRKILEFARRLDEGSRKEILDFMRFKMKQESIGE